MTAVPRPDPLTVAVLAREEGRDEEARQMLLALHEEDPESAAVNLQCAWVHDKLGLEAEAGLEGQDLRDALLGLGSTYRALGRYGESLRILDQGVTEFPDDPAMEIFQAMALYSEGRAKEACELLLTIMATTDQPAPIAHYRSAIAEYARDLDRTWQ